MTDPTSFRGHVAAQLERLLSIRDAWLHLAHADAEGFASPMLPAMSGVIVDCASILHEGATEADARLCLASLQTGNATVDFVLRPDHHQ